MEQGRAPNVLLYFKKLAGAASTEEPESVIDALNERLEEKLVQEIVPYRLLICGFKSM